MVDAREYHDETNHSPRRLREMDVTLDQSTRPRPYKVYTDLPQRSLPDPADPGYPALAAIANASADPPGDAPPADEAPPLDARELHTLCHYATGITKELVRQGQRIPYRAASCTGKLYHVDLYAVVGEDAALDAGVYHFDPHEAAFDVVREGDHRDVLVAAAGEQSGVAQAPVTLVATSEWWRNAWKYRARTYRHAFWDSGTILANLLATAHGRGHRAEVVVGFADEPVARLLGVEPEEEAPLELVPLGRGADPADVSTEDAVDVDSIDPATEPVSSERVAYPLVPDAWRQSRLVDGAAAASWRDLFAEEAPTAAAVEEGADVLAVGEDADATVDEKDADAPAVEEADASAGEERPSGDGDSTERIALDPVDRETASARPLSNTVERRGSLREYSHEAISDRKFATVLDRALRDVPVACLSESDLSGLVDYYCLVHAVDGIDQGTYEYHPATNELERVGDVDRDTAGHLALGQTVVGDAAVNVYAMADVDAVVEDFGNRGYRLAQLEGGIAMGRLYLATYAHRDLGGRGFTFHDTLVQDHLSPHAGGQTPMTMYAFGKPAE